MYSLYIKHYSKHFMCINPFLKQLYQVGTINIHILQMRSLRLRKVKKTCPSSWGHTGFDSRTCGW